MIRHRGNIGWLGALLTSLVVLLSPQADEAILTADFSVAAGRIRPLHGLNKGPLVPGGLFDVVREHRELGVPFARLHDCGWPNPYVVDHHAVFANPNADPTRPESYDFRLTDEYLAAVRRTGAEPIYRLGESIEHTTVKRHVHPPADPDKWAAVCLGIIRHYNEGWADGFHYGIRHWEIWNEPENRPAMWTGTDEDYLRLYRTAARAIKREFPSLKVGGPALGASGQFVPGEFVPTDFAVKFLTMCRTDQVPLNFFSWHCYTADPAELTARARAIRRLLDGHGFTDTESHLNEWNYLPGNSWAALGSAATPASRQNFYADMSGAPGAAFAATALIELQEEPVDVCNFFHGELGGFGLFTEHGAPLKVYHALRAFQGLRETSRRVATQGAVAGRLAFAAGLSSDGREASMLISNSADPRGDFVLQWQGFAWTGGVTAEIRTVGTEQDFSMVRTETLPAESASLRLPLKAPAVAWVRLRPTAGAAARSPLTISSPASRLVFQRSLAGDATIPVVGTGALPGATVEARLVDVATGRPGDWTALGSVQVDYGFRGQLRAAAGWYSLEVRARGDGFTGAASVGRVGVGEVFVVVGHSVAHGGDINLPGATDDRVNTIALPVGDREAERRYLATGDPQFLPPAVGRQFGDQVRPAPAGHGTYFWAAFAEQVARRQNVPVLMLNAAFGGSSLEHWAMSARGESFAHPFVNASLRMPYRRLEHALTRYGALTGVRAILSDQGQNDWPEPDAEKIAANYAAWIEQARIDAGCPHLAVVVNRQSPPGGNGNVRGVQERMIRQHPYCYPGPDYDSLGTADRTDGVHVSATGAREAARLWAEALGPQFFQTVSPMLAPSPGPR